MANDVREQNGLQGEDLTEREDPMMMMKEKSKERVEKNGGGSSSSSSRPSMTRQSTIRIKPSGSKSFDDTSGDDMVSPTVSPNTASTDRLTLSSSFSRHTC